MRSPVRVVVSLVAVLCVLSSLRPSDAIVNPVRSRKSTLQLQPQQEDTAVFAETTSSSGMRVFARRTHVPVCDHMLAHFSAGGAGAALIAVGGTTDVALEANWWGVFGALPNVNPARGGLASPADDVATRAAAMEVVANMRRRIAYGLGCGDLLVPAISAHMAVHFATVNGAAYLNSGANTAALLDYGSAQQHSWWPAWVALGNAHASRAGLQTAADNAIVQAVASAIMPGVAWRLRHGRAVTDASSLVAYMSHVAAARVQATTCTIGVEWEMHGVAVMPSINALLNQQCKIADTAMMNAPFGSIPYYAMTTDHAGATTILEIAFGPLPSDGRPDGHGPAHTTEASLTTIHTVEHRIKQDIIAESMIVNGNPIVRAGLRATPIARLQARIAALVPSGPNYAMTTLHYGGPLPLVGAVAGQHACPGTNAPAGTPWSFMPYSPNVNNPQQAHEWQATLDDPTVNNIQVNYLVPVSALASSRWLDFSANDRNDQDQPQRKQDTHQYAMARYARYAAVTYLTDTTEWPAALMTGLTNDQKGDLFGVFTQFFHMVGVRVAYGMLPPAAGTVKNLFHHMIKTEPQAVVQALVPPVADAIHEWYTGKAFGACALFVNGNRRAGSSACQVSIRNMMKHLRDAWKQSDSDDIKAAAAVLSSHGGEDGHNMKVTKLNALLNAVHSFDAMRYPMASVAISGTTPPATFVAHGGGGDSVLAVVVESRKHYDPLNRAVFANQHATVSNLLTPLCKQYAWSGTDPWHTKTKNVGTA